jgi:hypothetical protein
MWWAGDFNLYLGSGDDREFKSLATPSEQILGSVLAGILSALVSVGLYGLSDVALGKRRDDDTRPTV